MPEVEEGLEKIESYKGLKIIGWNVRSLAPKIAEFELILDKISPDLVCICESWLNETTPDGRLEINGYNLFRYDRTSNKKGGWTLHLWEKTLKT